MTNIELNAGERACAVRAELDVIAAALRVYALAQLVVLGRRLLERHDIGARVEDPFGMHSAC